jgi:hypothetical protein
MLRFKNGPFDNADAADPPNVVGLILGVAALLVVVPFRRHA